MIQILLSTDNNYMMPTGVLMHSIGENSVSPICYHVMIDEKFEESNKKLLESIASIYGSSVSYYCMTSEQTEGFPLIEHITMPTYYRLFASEILPETLDKVLYLDGDMIVRHSLDELWNVDIDGYAIGVAEVKDYFTSSNWLPYDRDKYGYFNAGMLLINLNYWREQNLFQTFMHFIQENKDSLRLSDQDVLNSVLSAAKKRLPISYNLDSIVLSNSYLDNIDTIDMESYMNPSVVHYSCRVKPWHLNCKHPLRTLWMDYFNKSQWKNIPLQKKESKPITMAELFSVFQLPDLPKPTTLNYWKIICGNVFARLRLFGDRFDRKYTTVMRLAKASSSYMWRRALNS